MNDRGNSHPISSRYTLSNLLERNVDNQSKTFFQHKHFNDKITLKL